MQAIAWGRHCADLYNALQQGESLVHRGVRVKPLVPVLELVVQDDLQAVGQALSLLLQSDLLLMHCH